MPCRNEANEKTQPPGVETESDETILTQRAVAVVLGKGKSIRPEAVSESGVEVSYRSAVGRQSGRRNISSLIRLT